VGFPGWDHAGCLLYYPNDYTSKGKFHHEDKKQIGGQYEISCRYDLCSGGDRAPGEVWQTIPNTTGENAANVKLTYYNMGWNAGGSPPPRPTFLLCIHLVKANSLGCQ